MQVQKFSGKLLMPMAILMTMAACSRGEEVIPPPTILVNSENPQHWDGYISGAVLGIDPRLYFISIYAEVDDKWYMVRDEESGQISIREDQTWSCPIGAIEIETVNTMQIFLLPTGFQSPVLQGEDSIPLKLQLAAASKLTLTLNNSTN